MRTRSELAVHESVPAPRRGSVVLEAVMLTKRFDGGASPVLQDVSFEVHEGEVLALVGPSGCGKTTLLRLLSGLTAPSGGAVIFDGRRIERPPHGITLVFQDYARSLFPWLTVAGNVGFALRRRLDVSRAERLARASAALAAVDLAAVSRMYPWQLSGGMQQRVAIARAIAAQPKVLLMDEPFASVDSMTRADLQDLILRVHGDVVNMTIVLVTHDIDEAVYLADRVVVLSSTPGRVIEEVDVDLPRPRGQTETRSSPTFLARRNDIHRMIARHRREPAIHRTERSP